MKKFLLSLAAAAFCLPAMAGVVTFDFVNNTYEMTRYSGNSTEYNTNNQVLATEDGIVLTNLIKEGAGNGTRLWSDGLRFYKGGDVQISSNSEAINKVTFTLKSGASQDSFSLNNVDGVYDLTYVPTSGNVAVQTLTIYYGEDTGDNPGTGEGGGDTPSIPGEGDENIVFDFVKNTYEMTRYSGNVSDYNTANQILAKVGDVTITNILEEGSGNGTRLWSDGLRFYKGGDIQITSTGEEIKGVTYTLKSSTEDIKVTNENGVWNVIATQSTGNWAMETLTVWFTDPSETPGPDVPDAPTGTITVPEAIALVKAGYTGEATVSGVVSQVDTYFPNYNSITYWISADGKTTNQMQVYSGTGLNGDKFNSIDDVEVGAKVVVKGTIKDYNGTVEFDKTSILLSYEAPEGGDQPGGEEPDDQYLTLKLNVKDAENIEGDFVEESLKDDGSLNAAPHYQPLKSFELGGYEFSFTSTSENAGQQPAYYCTPSTNANTAPTVRIYNGTSMTITSANNVEMTKIQFKGSNMGNNANLEVNTGNITSENNAVWEGRAKSVTITTNVSWRITSLDITYDTTTGVEEVEMDAEGEAVYFNLQGVRVNNPERGIFVKVQNGKATKVVK